MQAALFSILKYGPGLYEPSPISWMWIALESPLTLDITYVTTCPGIKLIPALLGVWPLLPA